MSNLQSDFQSSQLMPQNFKNSAQAPAMQSPSGQQSFQRAQSSQLLHATSESGTLSVDIGNGRAVLGQSTDQVSNTFSVQQPPQSTSWGLVYGLAVVSLLCAILAYFFLKKYINLNTKQAK